MLKSHLKFVEFKLFVTEPFERTKRTTREINKEENKYLIKFDIIGRN